MSITTVSVPPGTGIEIEKYDSEANALIIHARIPTEQPPPPTKLKIVKPGNIRNAPRVEPYTDIGDITAGKVIDGLKRDGDFWYVGAWIHHSLLEEIAE